MSIGSSIGSGAGLGASLGSVVPGLGNIVGGVIGGIGGLLGGLFASGDQDKARAAMEAAIKEITSVGAPPDLSKQILLEKFKQAGLYTPALEQKIDMEMSKVAGIQEDPNLRKAQVSALERLGQLSKSGLGPQEMADLMRIQQNVASDTEGKRQQIIQNLQARGQAGGGAELAASLQGAQSGANRLANEQLNVASQASQRALQALAGYGSQAGSLRSQDFGVEQAKAQAADELSKFNTANSINRQSRNIAAQNQAQAFNLQNEQDISNKNVLTANEEARRQAQAQRDYWNDILKQKQLIAAARSGEAGMYQNRADQTRQDVGNVAGGISDAATGYLDAQAKEKLRIQDQTREDAWRKQMMDLEKKKMSQNLNLNSPSHGASELIAKYTRGMMS